MMVWRGRLGMGVRATIATVAQDVRSGGGWYVGIPPTNFVPRFNTLPGRLRYN